MIETSPIRQDAVAAPATSRRSSLSCPHTVAAAATLLVGSVALLFICSSVAASAENDTSDQSFRVGGNLEVEISFVDGKYRSGRAMVEESLPVGYPMPTPPDAIDLKYYPSIRRAETDATRGRNGAFFPLFNHIQSRDIAMTSPVEMDYNDLSGDERDATMSFLYRSPDLGPTTDRPDSDGVQVVDTDPMIVLSVGLRGPYGQQTVARGRMLLNDWLDGQNDWAADDSTFRALYYNGPYIPNRNKWSEIQIGVKPLTNMARVQKQLLSAAVEDAPRVSNSSSSPKSSRSGRTNIGEAAVAAASVSASSSSDAMSGSHQARRMMNEASFIDYAVQRGAPLFNEGKIDACVAIYEVTIAALLDGKDSVLSDDVRLELRDALRKENVGRHVDDPLRKRAWRLREALDIAYAQAVH